MSPKLQSEINDKMNEVSSISRAMNFLLDKDLNPSDGVYYNFSGSSLWFVVSNREDLQVFMTLSPLWNKRVDSNIMEYKAQVEGIDICIRARDAALPPTCKEVEEVVTVPAKEAYTYVNKRIICDV